MFFVNLDGNKIERYSHVEEVHILEGVGQYWTHLFSILIRIQFIQRKQLTNVFGFFFPQERAFWGVFFVCPVDQMCYPECLGFLLISCWDESAGCTTLLVSLTVVLKMLKKKKSGTDHCLFVCFLLDLCIWQVHQVCKSQDYSHFHQER